MYQTDFSDVYKAIYSDFEFTHLSIITDIFYIYWYRLSLAAPSLNFIRGDLEVPQRWRPPRPCWPKRSQAMDCWITYFRLTLVAKQVRLDIGVEENTYKHEKIDKSFEKMSHEKCPAFVSLWQVWGVGGGVFQQTCMAKWWLLVWLNPFTARVFDGVL